MLEKRLPSYITMPCRRVFVYAMSVVFIFSSCLDSSGTTESTDETEIASVRQAMAEHFAQNYILYGYQKLAEESQALASAIDAFAQTPNEANLATAQSVLKTARVRWQYLAVFNMGPAQSQAITAAINTYPVSARKIETNITSESYTVNSISNYEAQGFATLGYLLHGESKTPAEIITAYTSDSKRGTYLKTIATATKDMVEKVEKAWREEAFLTDFQSSDATGTDVGSSLSIIVNALDIHLQRFVRDGKVGIPAGVRSAGIKRPTATEAYYGGYDKTLLLESLTAYSQLFEGEGINGKQNTSLRQYLIRIGHEGVWIDAKANIDKVIEMASALPESLSDVVENDNDKLISLFQELQKQVTLVKSDLVSVMGITITNQDNDGD